MAAAIETCRTVQYDINFPLLSQKYGISVPWSHLRDVAERLKRLGLLESRPEALRTPPKEYSSGYLRSLQLRVHYSSTQPNLDNIAVALDLLADPSLDVITAGVWRRLEIGTSAGKTRHNTIHRLKTVLGELKAPLDVPIDAEAVEEWCGSSPRRRACARRASPPQPTRWRCTATTSSRR